MNYEAYFDELNVLSDKATNTYNDTRKLDDLLDFIEDLLLDAVIVGLNDANDDLRVAYELSYVFQDNEINDLIYAEVNNRNWVARVMDKLIDSDKLRPSDIARIVETEAHRIINSVKFRIAQIVYLRTGKRIYKKWETKRDDRVRDQHKALEGVVVGLNDKFVTPDGDKAYYPGGFTYAENNINCRCVVKFI